MIHLQVIFINGTCPLTWNSHSFQTIKSNKRANEQTEWTATRISVCRTSPAKSAHMQISGDLSTKIKISLFRCSKIFACTLFSLASQWERLFIWTVNDFKKEKKFLKQIKEKRKKYNEQINHKPFLTFAITSFG